MDIPSYRVSENDVIEVAQKSLELTPMVVARAEAGERRVPAWLEVMPDQMRILVHRSRSGPRSTPRSKSS